MNRTVKFIYVGKTYKNCDPSKSQKSALAADSSFRTTLQSSYGTDFSESQQLFNNLNANFESIVAKGPSQEGMSPQEKAAENSQALNSAAAANKNVQALIGQKASMSNATPGVESGVVQAERATAATNVENNLSNKQTDIVEKSFELGRENYNNAVKADLQLPGATMDPVNQAGGEVIGAEKVADDQANANAAAQSSWMGIVGGLAGDAVGAAGTAAGCVTPDTKIVLYSPKYYNFTVPAYGVKVGDILEGIQGPEKVIRLEESQQPCVHITLTDGKWISVSKSHTFALADGGYTEAWDAFGKKILTHNGHSVVERIESLPIQPVIKICLTGAHAYLSNGIWSLE